MRSYSTSRLKILLAVSEFQIVWSLEMKEVEACMLLRLTHHSSLLHSLGIGKQPSKFLFAASGSGFLV